MSALATLGLMILGLASLAICAKVFEFVGDRKGNRAGWFAAFGALMVIAAVAGSAFDRLTAIQCGGDQDCIDGD